MPQSGEGWGEVGHGGGCVGTWGNSLPLIPFTVSHHLGCPLVWAGGWWLVSLTPCAYPSRIHIFHLVVIDVLVFAIRV